LDCIIETAEKVCFGQPVNRYLCEGWNGVGLPPELRERIEGMDQ
jgi:hypothetical protein